VLGVVLRVVYEVVTMLNWWDQGKAKANIFNVLIMYKENLFVGDNIIKNK
jgi:hypothetical protein